MRHVKPKKGMLVILSSVKEIEDKNSGKSPVQLGTLGKINEDPDENDVFKVGFFQKAKAGSPIFIPRDIEIMCVPSMVDLVIDQKIKIAKQSTAIVRLRK